MQLDSAFSRYYYKYLVFVQLRHCGSAAPRSLAPPQPRRPPPPKRRGPVLSASASPRHVALVPLSCVCSSVHRVLPSWVTHSGVHPALLPCPPPEPVHRPHGSTRPPEYPEHRISITAGRPQLPPSCLPTARGLQFLSEPHGGAPEPILWAPSPWVPEVLKGRLLMGSRCWSNCFD